ncbi:MAG: 2OG-Fe(II) oxygenase family protein [Actinomycetota bacterium]
MSVIGERIDLIPVLDLAGLGQLVDDGGVGPQVDPSPAGLDPDRVTALGVELERALTDVGFFFIINHGVDWDLVRRVYGAAAELHAMPSDHLASIAMDAEHGGYLTYAGGTSYASQIAGEVRTPNLNAAFFIHRGGYRLGNRWPDLPGFRELVDAYMDATTALARRLLPVLAASLDLPATHFDEPFDDPSVTLRLSHYPPVDYGEHDWGLAPHTDSSIFTFLPANDVPGLEIRPAGHEWMTPPNLPESFLVNSGDMLKRWTNHRFRSTAHRARNGVDAPEGSGPGSARSDRYAIPFFFGTRDDAVIEALPTCVGPEAPARHDPITYGDYQRWFLNRNYAEQTGREASEEAP